MALMIVSWIIDFEQSAKMTSAVDEVKVKFDKADATIRVYYPPTKENWTCPSRF